MYTCIHTNTFSLTSFDIVLRKPSQIDNDRRCRQLGRPWRTVLVHRIARTRTMQIVVRLVQQTIGRSARIAMLSMHRRSPMGRRTATIVSQVRQRSSDRSGSRFVEGDTRRIVHAFGRSHSQTMVEFAHCTTDGWNTARSIGLATEWIWVAWTKTEAFGGVERIAAVEVVVGLGGLGAVAVLVYRPLGDARRCGHAVAGSDPNGMWKTKVAFIWLYYFWSTQKLPSGGRSVFWSMQEILTFERWIDGWLKIVVVAVVVVGWVIGIGLFLLTQMICGSWQFRNHAGEVYVAEHNATGLLGLDANSEVSKN